jgi:hypothetical protein
MMSSLVGMSLSLLFCFCALLLPGQSSAQYGPLMAPLAEEAHASSLFSFNSTWHVLGPFQIGTRGMSMLKQYIFASPAKPFPVLVFI